MTAGRISGTIRKNEPFQPLPPPEPPQSPGFRWGECGRDEKAITYQSVTKALNLYAMFTALALLCLISLIIIGGALAWLVSFHNSVSSLSIRVEESKSNLSTFQASAQNVLDRFSHDLLLTQSYDTQLIETYISTLERHKYPGGIDGTGIATIILNLSPPKNQTVKVLQSRSSEFSRLHSQFYSEVKEYNLNVRHLKEQFRNFPGRIFGPSFFNSSDPLFIDSRTDMLLPASAITDHILTLRNAIGKQNN